MKRDPACFEANVREGLRDVALGRTLLRATRTTLGARAAAVAAQPGWAGLRRRAAEVRSDALARLPELLEQLEERLRERGVTVHWAEDGPAACRIIVDIAHAAGARRVVKGKSMASEEIHLGEALSKAGIAPIETDLGELIVQLAGQPPSHITAPALHLSRREIGAIFADELGVPFTDDPDALVAIAREHLRREFLDATVGVTGVNFAVAESGTLVLVENEGNIRLATTLPRVHVALMGIEKVVPRLADAAVLLRVLARSATGQRATSYVSLLAGPRRGREADGPEQVHVVLLDNGRSRLLADAELRGSLACIRCGACMNVCPVFQHVGGHAYGWTVPGPIGSVLGPALLGRAAAALPHGSSLCGACTAICPVGIDLHGMLLTLRGRTVRDRLRPWRERLAFRLWRLASSTARRFALAGWLLRLAGRLGLLGTALRVLGWGPGRAAPALPSRTFRQQVAEVLAEREP